MESLLFELVMILCFGVPGDPKSYPPSERRVTAAQIIATLVFVGVLVWLVATKPWSTTPNGIAAAVLASVVPAAAVLLLDRLLRSAFAALSGGSSRGRSRMDARDHHRIRLLLLGFVSWCVYLYGVRSARLHPIDSPDPLLVVFYTFAAPIIPAALLCVFGRLALRDPMPPGEDERE